MPSKSTAIPLETSISESSHAIRYVVLPTVNNLPWTYTRSPHPMHPTLLHLAMYASSFLLTLEFTEIADEVAAKIGSIYLLRLYKLLTERTREFKRILLPPPQFHVSDRQCNTKSLEKAWRLAVAYLLCSAAPDVSAACMDGTKNSVIDQILCERCKASLERRFDDLKNTLVSGQGEILILFVRTAVLMLTEATEHDIVPSKSATPHIVSCSHFACVARTKKTEFRPSSGLYTHAPFEVCPAL